MGSDGAMGLCFFFHQGALGRVAHRRRSPCLRAHHKAMYASWTAGAFNKETLMALKGAGWCEGSGALPPPCYC